ncbi:MAG: hypothetical protein KatS3mg049_0819 [Caldilinea sp.]|jgi:hypothetical protein|uniref:Uncharacterized protein n=1 Tax=Caldilinea aerophila (strain DSM 14535 / JCM 11387 / NBRC 104270 / STL-6-O1) TaxID=926550 RepID=I0I6N6_CALAS|nr:hypothetical protein CLDAP_28840 [Caldilinea aerophila DSM 14535 = NBRC 104270]GIV72263.1 MAG: hypothetical protein KatS3mg049_0819 [Caldilinea sp.]
MPFTPSMRIVINVLRWPGIVLIFPIKQYMFVVHFREAQPGMTAASANAPAIAMKSQRVK